MSSRNSQNEPFYISLDIVLEIHQSQLKEFGGAEGIRNRSGLEAAVESPKPRLMEKIFYQSTYLKTPLSLTQRQPLRFS